MCRFATGARWAVAWPTPGDVVTAASGLGLIDESRGEIGVDSHLFAGHGVEGEAGGDFGDASGALGDDHELNDGDDGEDDQADDQRSGGHEGAELLDDVAGGGGALVGVGQDESGGGGVQHQA